jgi:hypothetical protein
MKTAKIPTSIKRIMCDAEKIREADELFTEALVALEKSDWDNAKKICKCIMATSISIEQRLATMCLEGLATGRDADIVKEYLEIAYNI